MKLEWRKRAVCMIRESIPESSRRLTVIDSRLPEFRNGEFVGRG